MTEKIKIAIVLPDILPVPAVKGGAIETIVENLLKQNEVQNKASITVYTIYDKLAKQESFKYNNTEFVFIKTDSIIATIYSLFSRIYRRVTGVNIKSYYIKSVLKHMNKRKFDRLIIEGDKNNVLPLKNNKQGLDIYLHIHHDAFKKENKDVNKNIIDSCKNIIVVSEYIKNKTVLDNNINKSKIKVLKNTIDTTVFNKQLYVKDKSFIREKYGIKKDEIVILFTGRLIPEKGIKELILAFKNIKTQKSVKLLIVGSSNFGLNVKNKYEEEQLNLSKDISDKIIFTGYIHNSELPKIHSVVDIAVVPSICNEAAGVVIIEAISSGIPLIATNVGGIPEYSMGDRSILIENDEFLVGNLSKALELLIENENIRNHMVEKSREYIKEYDNPIYYKNLIEILSK